MLLKPVLKYCDCIDHDPIDEWIPSSDTEVFYYLCLHIGPADNEGADLFNVQVVTPLAINEHNLGKTLSKYKIVVNPYSWDNVLSVLNEILYNCEGVNWNQQASQLSKYFDWEFENYQP